MKSLGLGLLISFLTISASAELDGLPPQRKAELERLLADTHSLRGSALATSRSLEYRVGREDIAEALRDLWSKVEAIDEQTYRSGDFLNNQISRELGQGRFSASVAAELRQCVDDSINGRRVLVYGYLWPRVVVELLQKAGVNVPVDLASRLELKAAADEVAPLSFKVCGARMRGYGITPPAP